MADLAELAIVEVELGLYLAREGGFDVVQVLLEFVELAQWFAVEGAPRKVFENGFPVVQAVFDAGAEGGGEAIESGL